MLFNFPSLYSFAIGLKTYLGLEVNVSQIPAQYPVCSTQEHVSFVLRFPYAAITLYGIPFQKTSGRTATKQMTVLQHHISAMFPWKIQFALCCFQSLLLTASQLISFPLGTKTF